MYIVCNWCINRFVINSDRLKKKSHRRNVGQKRISNKKAYDGTLYHSVKDIIWSYHDVIDVSKQPV